MNIFTPHRHLACQTINRVQIIWLAMFLLIAIGSATHSAVGNEPPITVIPTLHFAYNDPWFIDIEFENSSNDAFVYFASSRPGEVYFFEIQLYRGDKYVQGEELEGPVISQDGIRELPAGGVIRHHFDLKERYLNLEPGRYSVRVEYDIPEDSGIVEELGMTPMQFKRTIMYIEIEEEE